MEKESKNSVTQVRKNVLATSRKVSGEQTFLTRDERTNQPPSGFPQTTAQRAEDQVLPAHGFLKIDYITLFWIFVIGCIVGLVAEAIFRAIQLGGYESRVGLVWGPFSPIYGVSAIILTLLLNQLYHIHNFVIFLVSLVLGSLIEYGASWSMEYFWGAIAWDYSGTFGNLDGRTNLAFGVMWGVLGLVWARIVLPLLKRAFSQIDRKSWTVRVITVGMSLFMAVDITVTVLALNRESQRANDIPATTWEQQFFDDHFPDSFMHARFENMSICKKT